MAPGLLRAVAVIALVSAAVFWRQRRRGASAADAAHRATIGGILALIGYILAEIVLFQAGLPLPGSTRSS